jgi:hypothetical protein
MLTPETTGATWTDLWKNDPWMSEKYNIKCTCTQLESLYSHTHDTYWYVWNVLTYTWHMFVCMECCLGVAIQYFVAVWCQMGQI